MVVFSMSRRIYTLLEFLGRDDRGDVVVIIVAYACRHGQNGQIFSGTVLRVIGGNFGKNIYAHCNNPPGFSHYTINRRPYQMFFSAYGIYYAQFTAKKRGKFAHFSLLFAIRVVYLLHIA